MRQADTERPADEAELHGASEMAQFDRCQTPSKVQGIGDGVGAEPQGSAEQFGEDDDGKSGAGGHAIRAFGKSASRHVLYPS